jgi:tetratricopeptide (TPR) repeat protein
VYQRDYLMRQIEQAARAVAAILKRALGGDPDGALAMFDEAYQPLLGISARVVSTLTDEQLVTLLTSGSSPDLRRVVSVLEVVKAEADVNGMRGDAKAATTGYRRSLSLAAYVAGHSDDQLDGGLAADLVQRADSLQLTAEQRLGLARVLEALGRYADAEDQLFEAIDAMPDDTRPIDTGILFYQRLLAMDDDALEAGDLPRDEVKTGLAELLRRQVPDEPLDWDPQA